jgi:site-specific DNA-cytosine methylase
MTPRALARFQSVPDDYTLPDANGLACEIIGNGVPPLLAKAIMESIK